MRHKFRLAQLLKYRKSIEDQQRIALAMIEEKQYRQEEKLFQLREAQRACQNQLHCEQGETSLHMAYLEALSQESFSRRKAIEEIQTEILEAKEELLEASKSRKIVEKLRDKERERHKQSILQEERKSLDEIAAVRFIRANSPSSGNL